MAKLFKNGEKAESRGHLVRESALKLFKNPIKAYVVGSFVLKVYFIFLPETLLTVRGFIFFQIIVYS